MNRSERQADAPELVEGVPPDVSVVPPSICAGDDPSNDDPQPNDDQDVARDFSRVTQDAINVARGFCMGAADTVPGVSGGTIALILGHYQRLVTAISRFDAKLLGMLARKDLKSAANHIDLRFLAALLAGILVGVAMLAGLMHWLLENRMPQTLAVFLGLMIASIWVVQKEIDRWTIGRTVALFVGAAIAVGISFLPTGTGNMSLPFLFLAASIAICAMILPGISGAFVLLLLGVYHPVTGLIKETVKLQFTAAGLIQLVVFACGCVFGLLAFSRLLRYLLQHYRQTTMAGLMGLMIGSMAKLWPLQRPTSETAALEMKLQVMEFVSPARYEGSLLLLLVLSIASAITVWFVEHKAAA